MFGFGWIFMLGLTVLVVLGIVALWRGAWGGSLGGAREDRSLTILRERYARGEINSEQFEKMKRELE
jgi:putative membrane protein